jgi:phosphinothricin acetyltransferase
LLEAILASTDAAAIWTVQSAVFPDKAASMRLHERAGFRV